jgi:hypothetical protein
MLSRHFYRLVDSREQITCADDFTRGRQAFAPGDGAPHYLGAAVGRASDSARLWGTGWESTAGSPI